MLANRTELINALVLLGLGTWILWYASFFPDLPEGYPGPGLFPSTIAIGFIILGILLLWDSIRKPVVQQNAVQLKWIPLLSGIALITVFPFLYESLGFLSSLSISCFLMGLLLKVKPIWAILTALATSGLIYLIFVVLLGLVL